ncbi:MAG: deoxyribonuclease [Chthoniobacter sp.]|jgi:deoxyribonuclease-4|nr:deoxyribonuclease [Chthoniobacter sp.]
MKPPLLGAHVSTAGGCEKAIDRALSIGCRAMQIFVKNNMQWFAQPLEKRAGAAFCDHPRRGDIEVVFGHSGYLINLAATNPDFHGRSVRSLREELVRADQLGLPFLVLHPGAHMGAGVEAGLNKVVSSLDEIFQAIPKIGTRVALEITAGQGSCLGHAFEHLAFIIENIREPERLCVCLDTAHLFAAGYDISTAAGIRKTFAQFDKIVGRKHLVALHLNDSKTALNSHVDRHEHIGKGRIGLEAFRFLMTEPRFRKTPKVLETPKGKEMLEDVENMKALRALIVEPGHRPMVKRRQAAAASGNEKRRAPR